ncbi:MAG: hypothetical protein M3319_16765 [Actinomycetota bacterium]|nr:hypothetical protein [Actinomycetota bacterium]
MVTSPALDAAYELLGLLPTAHPLMVAKARTALLTVSTSTRREMEIEAAYATVMRYHLRGKSTASGSEPNRD